ncbi:MAG: HAD family phosphatase [Verrucomicrobia bacterium]|nr:HAD family phosphatase [Verrucomicrobiota bacterium]NBU10319.1 HAD family phosphatase [Pseudomonadota bacterium]NDA66610.1 HAD family phosphatase [Verrucomicrobiota bacterium]NDB75314.1 HAD family phosphatase [Verrucomicrobiota bacterium]NDD38487.1 HAD family phosphatase [Verrucomicrobiota bacterium]
MSKTTSPTPTAVIFDLGKVLLDFDYGIVARRLAAHSGRDAEQIRGLLDQSPLLHRFESGRMTNDEFFREVSALTGYTGVFEEFADIFGDIFAPIAPMIDLHAQLRARGVPTFIFSNTNDLAIRHIRANFPFFANFTGYIYSHEARAMKPDARIYEVIEQRTQRTGAALLYVDDRKENVDAGAARGWRVVHHETPEQTIAAVRAAGLL